MSLGADILLKIRSTFESKPVEEATEKTEELGRASDKAGKDTSGGMNVMAAATALMTGNINGAIAAIAPLVEKLKVLKTSLTSMTLFGALFATLAMGFKAMRDAADAAAQRLAGIKGDNLRNEITSTAEAYDKLKTSMDAATAKDDAILEHNQAMIEANKRLSLSINEISKQRELASAKDDDERRVIENKYKGKADQISGMSDQEKENASLQRSIELENDINAKIQAVEERKREATSQAEKALKQSQNNSSTAREKIGYMSMAGGTTSFDTWSGIALKSGADTDTAIKEFGEADEDIKKLEIQKESVRRARDVAQKNRDAGSRERTATSMATSLASSDIQKDITKKTEIKRLEDEKEYLNRQQKEAEERFGGSKDSAVRSRDIEKREMDMSLTVRSGYLKKGDKKGSARATAEYLQAQADFEASERRLQEVTADAARTIKGYERRINLIEEQIKRVGQ